MSAHSLSLLDGETPRYKTDRALPLEHGNTETLQFQVTSGHRDSGADLSVITVGSQSPQIKVTVDACWILCYARMVPGTRDCSSGTKDHLSSIPLTRPIGNTKCCHSGTPFRGSKTSIWKCEAEGLGTKSFKRITMAVFPLLQVFNILSLDRDWLLVQLHHVAVLWGRKRIWKMLAHSNYS